MDGAISVSAVPPSRQDFLDRTPVPVRHDLGLAGPGTVTIAPRIGAARLKPLEVFRD
jgi:hypothetical protein